MFRKTKTVSSQDEKVEGFFFPFLINSAALSDEGRKGKGH